MIEVGGVALGADLNVPDEAAGVVVFAHGMGSGRASPRNRFVADALEDAGLGTLLVDLVAEDEGDRRFDIDLLGERVVGAVDWLAAHERASGLPVGIFGASTGAAGALVAAAERPDVVAAVVSRGGRPDLAGDALGRVRAPTLLIVGGNDVQVLELNRDAMQRIAAETALEIVEGASHLFEEPGALEQVAVLARDWFSRHLIA
jgi:dienelactone hydrolase